MTPRNTSPCLVLALLAIALFVVPAAPAHAEAVSIAQVVKQLDTSLKSKEPSAVATNLASVIAAHKTAAKKDRAKLLSAVAKVLRKKDEALKSAALDAFEEMGNPDAWKHYGSLLKAPIHKRFGRIQSQAMDVTRALTPESAVKPLLKILKKSKNLNAAARALRTLGAYKGSRSRTKILDEIITAVKKEKPGIRGRDNTVWYGPRQTGEQARNRWQALAGPMVAAANELTGRDLSGTAEWFQMWSDNRRNLKALFESE